MRLALVGFAMCTVVAWSQKPIVAPGGVVNAASYATGVGPALAPGSIASIFGSSLAGSVQMARTAQLPTTLGGTAVSVNGVMAPLFYVSPSQINFQIPTISLDHSGIVVSTAAGHSDPYLLDETAAAPAIFTENSNGCGAGAVLNVSADGSLSPNSAANSVSPGNYISLYGTGNGPVYPAVPDGTPSPFRPLAVSEGGGGWMFDFSGAGPGSAPYWVGRTPGLVGVDQFNITIPAGVRQGCAVPLQVVNSNISPPVTISISSDGGACVDPPEQGFADIVWEKTTTTYPPVASNSAPGVTQTITETNGVTASIQASPGREPPIAPVYKEGGTLPGAYSYSGSSCPIPGYRSLDAGAVTVSGPGFPAIQAPTAPLSPETVLNINPQGGFTRTAQVQSGQASGLTAYVAALPDGAIQSGSFTVAARGGSDLGSFQSTVEIGSSIQVTTALAGIILNGSGPPFTIAWTGGDPDAWVTVKLIGHRGSFDQYPYAWVAHASDHQITIQGAGSIGFAIAGPVELVLEEVPDPSKIVTFLAPGLTLGGRTRWRYVYRYEGVVVQ